MAERQPSKLHVASSNLVSRSILPPPEVRIDSEADRRAMLEQAGRVVRVVHDVLDRDTLGVYLHGSATLGGLRPNSDIDLVAVTARPTSDDEKRELIDRITRLSRRGDPSVRSVELAMVVQPDIRPWRHPAPVDFKYGDWLCDDFERGTLTPWASPDPDMTLCLSAVLQADHPLDGPSPSGLLDPVPADDIRHAVLDSIPQLLEWLDGDEANVTMTFARIWVTLVTGAIVPKDVAADWAIERLPVEHHAVLVRARTIYLEGLGDAWEPDLLPRVRPCVDRIHAEILASGAVDGTVGAPRGATSSGR